MVKYTKALKPSAVRPSKPLIDIILKIESFLLRTVGEGVHHNVTHRKIATDINEQLGNG